MRLRSSRLALTALFASVSGYAVAQPTGPAQDPGSPSARIGPPSTTAAPAGAASAVASSTPPEGAALSEVVVTARKRSENVQSIPSTVQVVGQTQLERSGAANITDLSVVAPGLNISQSPTPDQFAVTVRGLGSEPGNPSFDSSVSLFVDGVYTARARDFQDALFDVSRIEVVRGTQAALLGKNTSLGAVNFVTNKPGNDFGINVQAQHELEYNSNLIEGGVDLPVNDKLAFRISGKYDREGGFVHNIVDDKYGLDVNSGAFRIVGVWKPTDKIDITGLYQTSTRETLNSNLEYTNVSGPVPNLLSTLAGYPGVFEANQNYVTEASDTRIPGGRDGLDHESSDRASVTIDWHLGEYTVTSQTAYLRSNINSIGDVDFLPGNYFLQVVTDRSNQVTEELRLASPTGGRLEYIVGALYLDNRYVNATTQTASYPYGPAPGAPKFSGSEDTLFNQSDRAYSAFGQANLRLFGPIKLVAGLRYTNETKAVDEARLDLVPGLYSLAVQPPYPPFSQSETEDSVDGSVGLNYQVTRDALLYASWGQGTKAGGFASSASFLDQSRYAAEVAQTAEGGFKSQFLERKLTVNGAFFYTTVSNYQLDTFTGVNFVVSNTDLESLGFESELDYAPVRDVRLFWTNTYADSYDTRVGGPIPFAPRYTGAFGGSVSHEVLGDKRASLDLNVDYRSSETSQQIASETPRLAASTRLNLSVGFADPSQGWELRLLAKNLNNEHVVGFNFPAPFLPAGNIVGVPEPPREVFLQLTLKR